MNASDRIIVAMVMLIYAITLPPICVAVYRHPPTIGVVVLTLIMSFWTWVLVEHIMWRKIKDLFIKEWTATSGDLLAMDWEAYESEGEEQTE